MDFQATGIDATSFPAVEDDFKSTLASELGLSVGQIELSLTPFRRRLVSENEPLTIYTKIQATEEDLDMINQVSDDTSSLTAALGKQIEGVEFEVLNTDVQAYKSSEPDTPSNSEEETASVSVTTFVVVVGILVVLLLVISVLFSRSGCKTVSTDEKGLSTPKGENLELADIENVQVVDANSYGSDTVWDTKRLPATKGEDQQLADTENLQVADDPSFGGELSIGDGVSTNTTELEAQWNTTDNPTV